MSGRRIVGSSFGEFGARVRSNEVVAGRLWDLGAVVVAIWVVTGVRLVESPDIKA